MNVVFTHEQADFDAIASLLGAYITQPNTLPVLPNRVNRNVREFLEIYATSYPFTKASDLRKEPIEKITLVDTQSLVTTKGISSKTHINVIDHHEKKNDLPSNWDFKYVPFGATTTAFVEKIKQSGEYNLNVIEATLLLLGIYEDTGTLTYTNTSAQDASAVAYLLSKQANLEIAATFLNPPLSPTQQKTFQKLLENSVHLNIYGLDILVAATNARDLDDEVSSIAHKMNDLFDPAALFIFVALKEGIRLVARSSTNRIDVAKIAKIFGGGGHRRASAALVNYQNIREIDLESIKKDLITILEDHVLPAIRVRNIMSKRPLTVSPQTSVEEARKLMERFGYEGFPVVKNNKIIGLLNRRAVDKALAHHLKKNASSLMEAGDYSVSRDDTLETLQKIMSESGWGQIPVISRTSGEITGIVTRTDLIKAMTGNGHNEDHRNLADAIRDNTSVREFQLLRIVSQTATELSMPIYIVGGFVRDLLLEKPSPDFDIVVEGDAIQLSHTLVNQYGGKVTSHKKFGTAKWWPQETNNSSSPNKTLPINQEELIDIPAALDLISARTEFYEKPTALPTIRQSSIKLDLHRRDFTINTMAIRLDGDSFGDVYDFWGGLNDLENSQIRVLHSLSFVDDPTRMLRAVRFEQRFDFEIEPRTLELLQEAVSLLDEVSGDRIRHELDLIFIEKDACKMLERLQGLGILEQIHPSLQWDAGMSMEISQFRKDDAENNHELKYATYIILVCRLLPLDLNEVINRLRFQSDIQRILSAANSLWHNQETFSDYSPGEFTERIEKYPALTLRVLRTLSQNQKFVKKIDLYLNKWKNISIQTSGHDLKEFNIPPGPIYRQILRQLKIAKINGEIEGEASERLMLKKLIEKIS